MKNIAILGSTGSIGTQTLQVVRDNNDIKVHAIAAGHNIKALAEQVREFRPKLVCVAEEKSINELRLLTPDIDYEVCYGMEGLIRVATYDKAEIVVTAIVGMIGIIPTIEAIKTGHDIALANKETLVTAGHIIMPLAREYNVRILPVDSEHSAIFQSLNGEDRRTIDKILLTASGGPFRGYTREQMQDVKLEDALKHPNWSMGAKVTIDSASMMNKGFEMIEARWLFGIPSERIEIVVHPQSIVHSMVAYSDGSVKAQLGLPDMRLPIRYALNYPERLPSACRKMSVADYANLTFEAPDREKFPLLDMAFEAIHCGGNVPCALNAANEIAVAAFLADRIGFMQMPEVVAEAVARNRFIASPTYDDYVATNAEIRKIAEELIK